MYLPKVRLYLRRSLPVVLLGMCVGMLLITSYVYARQTSSFRFFDEENNIVAGYLMHSGRHLYRDIFMNHHPLPIVISQLIQSLVSIDTLFELVKYHRMFMILLAGVAGGLLILRFRTRAALFIFAYEFIKFYLSGQMFLAEGMIAYGFAYLVLLISGSIQDHRPIRVADLIASTLVVAGILLSREPYVPVALLLYAVILYNTKSYRMVLLHVGIGSLLIVVFMLQYRIDEYFKQVVLLNWALAQGDLKAQQSLQAYSGILQLYQYVLVGLRLDKPLYIILAGFVILFVGAVHRLLVILSWKSRMVAFAILILILFSAGVRNYAAGSEWYGMYRSIPYIVILISFVSSLVSHRVALVTMICVMIVAMLHPRSHFNEQRVNAREYYINYSHSNQVGQVLGMLCRDFPGRCTLHIDDIDVYPYWVSKLPPSYRYAFYYPVNKAYLDYSDIRDRELSAHPPVLYYDSSCHVDPAQLPASIRGSYTFLDEATQDGKSRKRSCIAYHAVLADYLDDTIISSIESHGYFLPPGGP